MAKKQPKITEELDPIFEDDKNIMVYLDTSKLHPHPDNPRKDLGDLEELANSIKANGIMQNLTVVPRFENDTYTVIIGHRRLAAAKLAELDEVPCVIVDMTPEEQLATMLLENMQRSDLTYYEQAQGFKQLMIDFGQSVEKISERTGFSQSTVRRRLKLAELDGDKLKKASEKQVSLKDLERLNEIEDVDERNKLLDYLGTNNFENMLVKAIDKQKENEQKNRWIEALAEKNIKEIPESQMFSSEYASVTQYRFDMNAPSVLENVIEDGTNYYYAFAYDKWVYIRKDKVFTSEEKEQEAEKERKYAEQRAKEEALRSAFARAFECRKRFLKLTSNATAKKFIKDVISYTICYVWTPNIYDNFDHNLYAEQMGIEIPEESSLNYELVQLETESIPEYALLCYAYALWNDGEDNNCCDYQSSYKTNAKLNALYSLLKKLGYEMSDEEKSLLDGSSELYLPQRNN
ncbi:MAG: ParB/RepB/Spo0J family partition protein [Clostridia bacterium]|nr:ParB/RepB/Spo0J family partition protein [Clostridia bacterium]